MATEALTLGPALDARFFMRLNEGGLPPEVMALSMLNFDSNQAEETYGWFGMSPTPLPWDGPMAVSGLKDYAYSLKNVEYQRALEIRKPELRRQKGGQFNNRVDQLAARMANHPLRLLYKQIVANGICYDGQNFFDTDHAESGTNQANAISFNVTTPNAPTAAEMADAIFNAIAKLKGFTDDQGEPLNEDAAAFHIAVPINLMTATVAALQNGILVASTGTQTNTLQAAGLRLTYTATPRLTDDDVLYVFRTDDQAKPFILQQENPISTALIDDAKENRFLYNATWSGALGYGFWQHAVKTQLT
jgi:phage major head subunit gpT-like protein